MNNKPLVLLIVAAFLSMSASALADDMGTRPQSEMTGQQVSAARQVAAERWYQMTPEERGAARNAARVKKDAERTALDEYVAAIEKRAPHLTLKVMPQDYQTPAEKRAKKAEEELARRHGSTGRSKSRDSRKTQSASKYPADASTDPYGSEPMGTPTCGKPLPGIAATLEAMRVDRNHKRR